MNKVKPPFAAIDIGGAGIKAARDGGLAFTVPIEVWRGPERLEPALREAIGRLAPLGALAATTTAELCDCFETKPEGVLAVLEALERAAAAAAPGAPVVIWRTDGRLAAIDEARRDPLPAAAANWLALAASAAALAPDGPALLADLGSTTADLVPIADGVPRPSGFTDTQRLMTGELIYTGVRRTPVFALAAALPYRGAACPSIPELFATMADAYVTLGDLPEDPSDHRTADGRELTRPRARDRLARAIGADRETFSGADARAAATALESNQLEVLRAGLRALSERMGTPPAAAVLAGEGEFLLQRALRPLWPGCRVISIADRLGPEASRAACAAALLDRLEELRR